MVTTLDIPEYRTRLIGLLGLKELSDAIARELYSRNLHSPPSRVCYSDYEMANLFENFHQELLQSDRDPKTIDRYWQIICSYRKWLDGRQPSVETAKQFISWLRNKGYRPRSVQLYYHVIKIFYDYILLPFKIKLRKEKTLPLYFDRGDVEAIIVQAEKGLRGQNEWQKKRNLALVLTFAYTGIRRSELLNLSVGDVDFNRQMLRVVKGKGNKDRVIPMADRIVVPLRSQCEGKGAKQKVFEHLNARSVYRVVTGLAKACGLHGFHPHSFRHYFATQLVEKGAHLRNIQALLGHESLETTAIYLDVSPNHLMETVARL
jgi:integrase/recombinase XerD